MRRRQAEEESEYGMEVTGRVRETIHYLKVKKKMLLQAQMPKYMQDESNSAGYHSGGFMSMQGIKAVIGRN